MFRTTLFACLIALSMVTSATAQWLTRADETQTKTAVSGVRTAERDAGPMAAAEWYMRQRKLGLGYIPKDAVRVARSQTQTMRAALTERAARGMSTQSVHDQILSGTTSAPWTLVGPSNIGGRIEAIAIHPTDPKTVYVGAADGGVWKTTDGGTTWVPLTDNMEALSMGSIAIDPQNPNVIYAGTGELPTGDTYTGYGLYRSTAAGNSWSNVGPTNVAAYSAVKVNPKHSNIIYASAGRSGGGVLRSTDTGATWQWLSGGLAQGPVTDLALAMNGDAAVLYAGVAGQGVFRSDDGGNNWTKLDSITLGFTYLQRISLDVDPNNWKNVVVLSVNNVTTPGFDNLEGIERSNDGGASWTHIDQQFITGNSTLFVYYSSTPPQGTYDVYVRADPSNFNHLLIGGLSVWELLPGSNTWTDNFRGYPIGAGIHPDQHAACFAPSDPTVVYFGSDGGMYSSHDGGSTLDQRPVTPMPMPITQFYGISVDQSVADMTYGGTQDNGTLDGSASTNWAQPGGGDGGYTLVDPNDPTYIYGEVTNDAPFVIHNNAARATNLPDSTAWLNPFASDAAHNTIYWGAQHLWSTTTKGVQWTELSSFNFGVASANGSISALDAFGDGGSLVIGTGSGQVYLTSDNASHLQDISAGLPGRAVTSARFNPSSATTFYVTLSGFGAGHVFKTTDAGSHWINISSTLPDIPVNTFVMDPANASALYIGTDVGVFFSPNDGAEWLPYGTGLPNVAVDNLDIHKSGRLLRAGTHGRSVWQAPLLSDLPGIVSPAQRTVWTIGDSTRIIWHGFGATVTVDLSIDGGASWSNLATNATGTSLLLDTVRYAASANALVRLGDGTQSLTSPLFEIAQQKAGAEVVTVGEFPYYFYDITYDPDLNVLWATNFYTKHLYKIDPDRGTVLDSLAVSGTGINAGNLTGIAYDTKTKHLFLHQVIGTGASSWTSNVYEVSKTGSIIRTRVSPAQYGTGLCVRGDTLLAADRVMSTADHAFAIGRALTSNLDFGAVGQLDVFSRHSLYGPRGLAFDTALGLYLMAYTDFQGDANSAQLFGSYLLLLDPLDGTEVKSYPIAEGGSELVNIRGLEYDPRGKGNSAWITTLTSGGSKLVKVVLTDGPASIATPHSGVSRTLANEGNALDQNYPNPSATSTTFPYTLPHSGLVEFRVLDALGRVVQVSASNESAGEREQSLDLSSLVNGAYRVELRLDRERIGARNLTLLR